MSYKSYKEVFAFMVEIAKKFHKEGDKLGWSDAIKKAVDIMGFKKAREEAKWLMQKSRKHI